MSSIKKAPCCEWGGGGLKRKKRSSEVLNVLP